jgi:hypothetical protein
MIAWRGHRGADAKRFCSSASVNPFPRLKNWRIFTDSSSVPNPMLTWRTLVAFGLIGAGVPLVTC